MDNEIIVVRKEGKRRMVKRFVLNDFKCKYCGGANLVLYGKQKDKQQWWCKDCKRKFSGTMSLPRMRSEVSHVGSAVQEYYNGMSLNAICRNIDQQYGYKPNNSTIYRWVDEFTDRAIKETKDIHPKVGDTWICDETVIKVGGVNYWFWDCIDADTRFLLASRMVTTRGTRDARALMELAEERAGKTPKVVVTDQLRSYLDGIELAFGSNTKHKLGGPFNLENNTNLIERFQGSLKDRTKILRGLKKPDTARHFLEGWLVHYNFFRPHSSLNGKTPAEKAGVKFQYKDWLALIRSPRDTAKIEVSNEPKPILRLHHPPVPRMSFKPRHKPQEREGMIIHYDGRKERQRRGTII
jgi:putative transposase